jgi:hypothetical protein
MLTSRHVDSRVAPREGRIYHIPYAMVAEGAFIYFRINNSSNFK